MKRTSSTKKFSLGIKIASILTCVVLTAVGFASWLIVAPVQEKESTGSFTVYEVETRKATIEVDPASGTEIIFGKSNNTPTDPWLVAADVDVENLTATFTVKVSTGTSAVSDVISAVNVTFGINDSIRGLFKTAIDGNYITAPVVTIDGDFTASPTVPDYNDATGEITVSIPVNNITPKTTQEENVTVDNYVEFTVTVEFGWGTAIGETNPYDYFNALTYDDTYATAAENALKAIAALDAGEDNTEFSLTISTTNTTPNE